MGLPDGVSQRYGSEFGPGSFQHRAKIVRRPLISAIFVSYDFLSVKNDVKCKVLSKSNKQNNFVGLMVTGTGETRRIRIFSGFISHRYGSEDPDPY